MTTLVFLLEEPSAQDLLEGLVPRLLPEVTDVRYLVFQGCQDLERQLVRKLKGWLAPGSVFVVLRDQDAAECTVVKERLVGLVQESGRASVLVRIACRDLESWVLGDWAAIAQAFDKPHLAAQGQKAIYREPDRLVRPVMELRKFIPDYQKRDGARRVGPLLSLDSNRSQSFQTFCRGLKRLLQTGS